MSVSSLLVYCFFISQCPSLRGLCYRGVEPGHRTACAWSLFVLGPLQCPGGRWVWLMLCLPSGIVHAMEQRSCGCWLTVLTLRAALVGGAGCGLL